MTAHLLVLYPHPKNAGEFALKESAGSSGGQEPLAHAASISSGGAPTIVVVIDEI
jgi:hypothetical protein